MGASDKNCDIAMDHAVRLASRAERQDNPSARAADTALAQVYVSMARELRLGEIKSRRYGYISVPVHHQAPDPEPIPGEAVPAEPPSDDSVPTTDVPGT